MEITFFYNLVECSSHQETGFGSDEAWLDHLRFDHEYSERDLVRIKLCVDQGWTVEDEKEEDDREQAQEEKRSNSGITASSTDDSPGSSKRVRVC